MRFACQSCGKAYNLPEEKIADKSNVKLKCRVCGAIVEVKRQGEVVAQILGDAEGKRTRVSEAPAPLTSISPDDPEDATHAIAVGDQMLSESGTSDEAAAEALLGHVQNTLGQRGVAPLPPPPPTGFGSAPVPPSELSPPELPRSEPTSPLSRPEPSAGLPPSSGAGASSPGPSPPPPLPGAPEIGYQNGRSGAPRFGDLMPLPDEPMAPAGALAPPPAAMHSAPLSQAGLPPAAVPGGAPAAHFGDAMALSSQMDMPAAPAADDTTKKMLAALATGILLGFIIAKLFF